MAALVAAQALLIESGPQAVTLKAVADRIGRTHANLLHHFGSAAELQKALAEYLAEDLCNKIGDTLLADREDGADLAHEVVSLVFDAFGKSGGGALVSWLLLSRNEDALVPVVEEISQLVTRLQDFSRSAEMTLIMIILAMGDARMGKLVTEALGLPRDTIRGAAEYMLRASAEHYRQADRIHGAGAPGPDFFAFERARLSNVRQIEGSSQAEASQAGRSSGAKSSARK